MSGSSGRESRRSRRQCWQAHVSRESKTVLLGANDSVAVAITDIAAGDEIGGGLIALTDIPSGHKVAVTAIGAGDTVIKYGQAIGVATARIAKGAHVHSHNLSMGGDASGLSFGAAREPSARKVLAFTGQPGTRAFPGLSPRQRPCGNSQPYRCDRLCQLLGNSRS